MSSVTVEAVDANGMKNGEMKEVEISDTKALLIKENGNFSALSHKCTHYGAPLIKGVCSDGYVRCPWHGACFNVSTGDIEDFPGLDSLQKYEVKVKGRRVFITASQSQLENGRRMKKMSCNASGSEHTLIIGGGAASVTCAETLRQNNFSGKITIVTKDVHLPYDRPKLSKAMDVAPKSILLRSKEFYSKHCIDVKLGKEAIKIDTSNKFVSLADGESISYSKLLLATGGKPRILPIPGWELQNVHDLRTPDDANLIAKKSAGKRVLVIGASFIGMEVASALVSKASSLTVCEYFSAPFERVLGAEVGKMIQKMHEEKGVKFCMNASVTELKGQNGVLKQAVLQNGTILDVDVAIVGVGVVPATDFIKNAGITMDKRGFIPVDKNLQTNVPDVYAAGDIALFPLKLNNFEPSNVQHWQMALKHGSVVGKNMAGIPSEVDSVPFFWSVQYGKSLRYTGYGLKYNNVKVNGSIEEGKFCTYYLHDDTVVAVATYMADPVAAESASKMKAGLKINF